ncbi:hypothetical protein BDV26DRAFT_29251 [Aspergillus bertholletiae]|uniref:Uncharacterized protein n=1 Tax=Aspergillus bertholletiae TaxID=1226010 RepID=A0A5N7BK99_9EURO|nr:hypothetical protein BDV26DRAFT_29251 [Aspergillus bertholletiae]
MLLLPSIRPPFVLHASHSPLSTGIPLVEFFESVLQKHLLFSYHPSSSSLTLGSKGLASLPARIDLSSAVYHCLLLYLIFYYLYTHPIPIGKLQNSARTYRLHTILYFLSHCIALPRCLS